MTERNPQARRRLEWFTLGQEAFSNVFPQIGAGYACPICWRVFLQERIDDGTLTLEHAPAGSMGGKQVALTCNGCNNGAGSKLESHALTRERMIDFAQGTSESALAVTLRSASWS